MIVNLIRTFLNTLETNFMYIMRNIKMKKKMPTAMHLKPFSRIKLQLKINGIHWCVHICIGISNTHKKYYNSDSYSKFYLLKNIFLETLPLK